MNEAVIEFGKSKESLKVFDGNGCWPGCDGFHLPLFHTESFRGDVVTKE